MIARITVFANSVVNWPVAVDMCSCMVILIHVWIDCSGIRSAMPGSLYFNGTAQDFTNLVFKPEHDISEFAKRASSCSSE